MIADRYALIATEPRMGGFSTVRRAVDTADGSAVAVKFVSHRDAHLTKLTFEREMAGLRSLRHPNIIRMRDSGIEEESGDLYIILDWIERSLHDVLKEGGPYRWDQFAEEVAGPLLDAISYAHLRSVEHRPTTLPVPGALFRQACFRTVTCRIGRGMIDRIRRRAPKRGEKA